MKCGDRECLSTNTFNEQKVYKFFWIVFYMKNDLSFFEQITLKIKIKLWIAKLKTSAKTPIPFWLFIEEFSETSFLRRKSTFFNVIFEQNTSKIKFQRPYCKTTDLDKDAHTIFREHFWLFFVEFSEIRLNRILDEYYTNCCKVTKPLTRQIYLSD